MPTTSTERPNLTPVAATLLLLSLAAPAAAARAEDAPEGTPPAAGPKKGFEAGGRAFSNPFANLPTAAGPMNDEDDPDEDLPDPEDLEEDFRPQNLPRRTGPAVTAGRSQNTPAFPAPPARNGVPPEEVPAPRTSGPASGEAGISLGGTSPGGVIAGGKAPAPLRVDDESAEGSKDVVTDFNFPDADIMDIAKTLGKLTGKNFIFDKDVKGRISIISNSPITVGDAWRAFLTALDINNFALIPSGKYIRIARQRDARDKQLRTFTGDFSPDTDALITRVFTIKYINAEEVARIFRNFVSATSRIHAHEQTNSLIVTETGANIAKLAKMLEILDIEGYDAGIDVIQVKYASASELSKLIDTLLPGTTSTGGAPRPAAGGAAGRFASRRTKEGGVINTIISDERTNTLIIHANQKGSEQVRELVSKLDQKLPVARGGKVHVYYLQFAEAKEISETLNNLTSGVAKSSAPTAGSGGTGVNPVAGSLFEGSIKVSPDKSTNSLVITASQADYETVRRVIARLDIPRDEVYAEVVIMEMSLNRDFNFSSNIALPTTNMLQMTTNTDMVDFLANPAAQKGLVLPIAEGNTSEITVSGSKVKVKGVMGLIKALQTNAQANVLATPQILTLDNTEATFETAEKIPVLSSTTSNGVVSSSVSKESVSLKVTIKPQINHVSNFVKLDINTSLADIVKRELPKQVENLAMATVERTAKTSVFVADGDTVVLGGLIRDTQVQTVSKIPLLGDIPILGWFFSSRSTESKKTNMLVFITPHIIKQYDKIRAILDRKLRERDNFIEDHAGGDDPLRKYRDDMIRSLPEMEQITSYKPDSAATIESAADSEAGGAAADADAAVVEDGGTRSRAPKTRPAAAKPTVPDEQSPAATPIGPETAPVPDAGEGAKSE